MSKKVVLSDDEILRQALPSDPEIKQEYNRLMDLFKEADPAAIALHRKTIARAAFLSITCDRLEKDVAAHGYQQAYNNGGGQSGFKKSTAADLLPNYTKLYLACMKQLQDVLQPTTQAQELDEFELFDIEQKARAKIIDEMNRAEAQAWIEEHGNDANMPAWVKEFLDPGGLKIPTR